MLTRRHVECGTTAEVVGVAVSGRQSEIGELDFQSPAANQHILRLQIPVVDAQRMAVLDGIQELEENSSRQFIVANKVAALGDVGEEVTFRAVFHDDERAIRGLDDLHQGDDIGVCARLEVECDLPLLKALLSGVESIFGQSLHGIGCAGKDVHSIVDHSVSSNSKDSSELQTARKQLAYSVLWACR